MVNLEATEGPCLTETWGVPPHAHAFFDFSCNCTVYFQLHSTNTAWAFAKVTGISSTSSMREDRTQIAKVIGTLQVVSAFAGMMCFLDCVWRTFGDDFCSFVTGRPKWGKFSCYLSLVGRLFMH